MEINLKKLKTTNEKQKGQEKGQNKIRKQRG